MSAIRLDSRALHLLGLVNTIHRYEEMLTQSRGEKFNIFNILRVGHYEVRTHSPMLAELLSPRGSHGQGSLFLQLFLTALKIEDFDAPSARVSCEVSAGELGRLDIVITDKHNQKIFIENKIYAGLQDRQLERYHECNSQAILLFLTLEGDEPPDWRTNPAYSKESFKKAFKKVSYRDDLVKWLELCSKEAVNAPRVREVITQYIHLIQRLTQQNTSTRMNEEIVKAVMQDTTGSSYLAYATLRNAEAEIRKNIIAKVNDQLDQLGKDLHLETVEKFAGKGGKEEQYFFTTPSLRAINVKFGLRCSAPNYSNFVYGIAYIEKSLPPELNAHVIPYFQQVFSVQARTNDFWRAYEYWSHRIDWDDQIMAEIISGEFAPDLDRLFRKLAQVAREATDPTHLNS